MRVRGKHRHRSCGELFGGRLGGRHLPMLQLLLLLPIRLWNGMQ